MNVTTISEDALRRAIGEIRSLRQLNQKYSEPIAIIGMSCRFPGAPDIDAYWRLLSGQGDAVCEVPSTRWDIDAYYDPDPDAPGKMSTRFGGFIEGIDQFDAAFFRISPLEANELDPQHRLLLETSWQALEVAGIDPAGLQGSRAGVFMGLSTSDYLQIHSHRGEQAIGPYMGIGNAHSAAVGRLSYALGLEGPAVAIDTACSSSLVAIDQACDALRGNKADLVLAGGVNALLTPEPSIYFSKGRFMAPDGRCKTFDARADGYVRGEGCGVLLLKRLSDAERDGDQILALIRGSAVNQDGASAGLTVPNGPAQQRVIADALQRAGLSAADLAYVEAHGTGTALGDPIEIEALHRAIGVHHAPEHPLLVGSVKTNIGHLEAAAGVASIIKVVLAMNHGVIPGQLHFETPSPRMAWDKINVQVVDQATAWPTGRHTAGVSGFAFQGTNAHVILESYVGSSASTSATVDLAGLEVPDFAPRHSRLLPLSGKTAEALRAVAGRYQDWLDTHSDADLDDMCFTAGVGRSHFAERAGIVFNDRSELQAGLSALLGDGVSSGLVRGSSRGSPRIAFLFTGQGSQWAGMGERLYQTEPVFRAVLDRCEAIILQERGTSLLDVMFGRIGGLDDTMWTQPALYALQVGLVELYSSVGVSASVVMGHSVGEIAAAYAAGVFDLETGLRLSAGRGALMGSLPAGGVMTAVFASAAQVGAALEAEPLVCLAADNGAHQVVSGAEVDVARLEARFGAEGIRTERLRTSHAFHSELMAPVLDDLERLVNGLTGHPAQLTLISNVTGAALGLDERLDGGYWRRHARAPVRFAEGLSGLSAAGVDLVVEIGPHPVLTALALSAWSGKTSPKAVASLRRGADEESTFRRALSELYVAGVRLDFAGLYSGETRTKLTLPTYPFQRQRYWVDTPKRRLTVDGHPLLGVRHASARGEISFESEISSDEPSWLGDHRVFERIVAPGALHGALAAAAWTDLGGGGSVSVSGVQLHAPLIVAPEMCRRLQILLAAPEAGSGMARSLEVYSRGLDEENWTLHATGLVSSGEAAGSPETINLVDLRSQLTARDVTDLYEAFAEAGIVYGPAFQCVSALWSSPGQALGEVGLGGGLSSKEGFLHPALLDGCFQVLAAGLSDADRSGGLYLPFGWERLWLTGPLPDRIWCHGRWREADDAGVETRLGDLVLCDENGRVLGGVDGFLVKRAMRSALLASTERFTDWLYDFVWRERPLTGGLLSASFMPDPATLAYSAPTVEDLLRDEGLEPHEVQSFRVDLERLALGYVFKAFDTLGWRWTDGAQVDTEGLRERLNVAAVHSRLFTRLLTLVGDADVLTSARGVDSALPDADSSDPDALKARLLVRYPFGRIELELLGRCGAALADVLLGRADPLTLLFSNDGASAADLYRAAPVARLHNRLVASTFTSALANMPLTRRLRVLEIGAGTGGTTSSVLPILPKGRFDYTYTDVSAGFFAPAKIQFESEFPFIDYRVLDIERDPVAQGFARHGYDIVLAANVLHATCDIAATLEHCRDLLAPEGLLVLQEVLQPQAWLDLTFGLLNGWWRFDDVYRTDCALLTGAGWRRVLAATGYSSTAVLGAGEHEDGGQGAIVARGPSEVNEGAGLWILAADVGGAAEALASGLAARGQTVVIAGATERAAASDGAIQRIHIDLTARKDWAALLTEQSQKGGPLRGVVHLCGLDGHGIKADGLDLAADMRSAIESALALTQALLDLEIAPSNGFSLITRGAQSVEHEAGDALAGATLWGLGKTLALEAPQLQPRMLDLTPSETTLPGGLIDGLLYPDHETHVAYRGEYRLGGRLVSPSQDGAGSPDIGAWRILRGEDGNLENLQKIAVTLPVPGPGEVSVRVEAAGLNFRDVLIAMHLYPEADATLGGEFCGHVLSVGPGVTSVAVGDRVIGFAAGAFANEVITRADLIAGVADRYSASALASIPIAFATSDLAFRLAGLKAGDRILIHAASGGVGLAAIQLAQRLGAIVYATASAAKQDRLRALGVEHVFDSRSTEFGAQVVDATAGLGVDVILNSLTGPGFIEASLSCLAPHGRFVEIGKRGIWSADEMASVRADVGYHILAIDHLMQDAPQQLGATLQKMAELLRSEAVTPLPVTVWPISDVSAAMTFMRKARHVGKIVLTVPTAQRKIRSDRTYLITGGLGGIGLAVAGWLADRGARHIVLNGRRSPDVEAEAALGMLAARGVEVRVMLADVCVASAVEAVLSNIDREMPPLVGVIHSVGVLADAAVTNQDWDRFETVLAPKALGAWHLHHLTQEYDLDLFVLFSSTAGVLGNGGQANHAAANAFLDQLARHRRGIGLPGQAIAWGVWSGLGEAEEHRARIDAQLLAAGIRWIEPVQGLKALGWLLDRDLATSMVLPIDWSISAGRLPRIPALLEEVVQRSVSEEISTPRHYSGLVQRLEAAGREERQALLMGVIGQELQAILRLPMPPDPTAAFMDLGMDSLTAVQLNNRLTAVLGKSLPVRALFDHPTIAALALAFEFATANDDDTIPVVDRSGLLPLSLQQERLWFLEKLDGYTGTFSDVTVFELAGPLDEAIVSAVLGGLYRRHETLRLRITETDGRPNQVFLPPEAFTLGVEDLEGLSPQAQAARIDALSELIDPKVGVFKAHLLRRGAEDHVLLFALHHLATDGATQAILMREFVALWEAAASELDVAATLPEPTLHYADYAAWQRQQPAADLAQGLEYWRTVLVDRPAPLMLPTDHMRPLWPSHRGGRIDVAVPTELVSGLKKLARQADATLFMVLETAFAALLSRYSDTDDLILGTAVAGRSMKALEGVVGPIANLIALRHRIDRSASFHAALAATRETVLGAFEHQEIQFQTVVDAVMQDRSVDRIHAPLFQIIFQLHTEFDAESPQMITLPDLNVTIQPKDREIARFDLDFDLFAQADGTILGTLTYVRDLYDQGGAEAIIHDYLQFLGSLCESGETAIDGLAPEAKALSERMVRRKTTFAVASTFTADPLEFPLRGWFERLGLQGQLTFTGYNQVLQGLLDPQSEFFEIERGAIFVLIRPEDWMREYATLPEGEALHAALSERAHEHVAAVKAAEPRLKVPLILLVAPRSPEWRSNGMRSESVRLAEEILVTGLAETAQATVISSYDICERWPQFQGPDLHDAVSDRAGHVPYRDEGYAILAAELMRRAHETLRSPFKAIVVDCDNTLWTGVVGEVEVTGLTISADQKALQQALVRASRSGILVCLSSKNDEADVLRVFSEHPDMSLSLTDIVGHRINWESKSANIIDLATSLSLGLDSFVFLDDNPIEVAEVQANAPGVTAVTLPTDGSLRQFVRHFWPFDQTRLTHEDQRRTAMYQETAQRETERQGSASYGAFLETLGLEVEIADLRQEDLPRAAQLTVRTNQFNAYPRPWLETALWARVETAGHVLMRVNVRDRFGDYGFVGLIGARVSGVALEVDTFLMSCRVLGRGVEALMLNALGAAASTQGLTEIAILHRQTSRNMPAQRFLGTLAVERCETDDDAMLLRLSTEEARGLKHVDETAETDLAAYEAREGGKARGVGGSIDSAVPRVSPEIWRSIATDLSTPAALGTLSAAFRARNRQADPKTQRAYVAPRTAAEAIVAETLAELLSLSQVGVHDSFFDLGGDSLMAVRLVSRLSQRAGRELPVRIMFENPTVAALALALEGDPLQAVSSAELFEPDIRLFDHLHPVNPLSSVGTGRLNAVLLTGATGFLGRHLLRELLNTETRKIICVLRAADQSAAEARLVAILTQIGVADAHSLVGGRIDVVLGDITLPDIGLSPQDYLRLSEEVDVILHNGADVNFVKPYALLRAANVLSVGEILKFMAGGASKRLHFVSTVGVFGDAGEQAITELTPRTPPETGGYALSKWVAENILDRAVERGFSVDVLRPGLIIGDTSSGFYDTDDTGAAFLKAALDLNALPQGADFDAYCVPVDIAAKQVVWLTQAPEDISRKTHLFGWPSITTDHIQSSARSAGMELEMIPAADWIARGRSLVQRTPTHPSAWIFDILGPTYDDMDDPESERDVKAMPQGFAKPNLPEGCPVATPGILYDAITRSIQWIGDHR